MVLIRCYEREAGRASVTGPPIGAIHKILILSAPLGNSPLLWQHMDVWESQIIFLRHISKLVRVIRSAGTEIELVWGIQMFREEFIFTDLYICLSLVYVTHLTTIKGDARE